MARDAAGNGAVKYFEIAFFVVSAALTLGGGLITVGARRPIRSAMGLLATIFGIGGCYLLLSAEFLAAIQLIVYAGAVVILFIFVVMLLGSAAVTPSDPGAAWSRYVSAGVFLVGTIVALSLVVRAATERARAADIVAEDFGSVRALGREVFTTKVVPFELTGALLLVAVVGAMAVARGKQRDPTRRRGDAGPPPTAGPSGAGGATASSPTGHPSTTSPSTTERVEPS
ncbi:MAG: NADH-quinone oxidoreductase subunit J [Myxococcota bacterium]